MKKQSSALDKKLMAANALISKAKESSANVEAQIKEVKSRGSGEGAGLGFNSAEKFQQKVATAAEKKEPFSLGSLRNFKRQRRTVLETSNAQAVDTEIENLLSEGRGGGATSNKIKATPKPQSKPQPKPKPKPEKKVRNEEDEYEEDYEQEYEEEEKEQEEQEEQYEEEQEQEPEQEEQEEDQGPISTVFEDSEFGPTEKDPSGIKSIGPVISDKVSGIQWTRMEKIADMGKCFFIEEKGKPLDPKNSFWIRKVIQGYGDLDFLNALILTATNTDLFNRLYDPAFDKFFEQGVYVFQFYKNSNQTFYVIVDDRIPSIQNQTGEYIPIGARSDKGSDYWVSLIEKAYSKLHMNYDNMCSNHLTFQNHFSALTGLLAEEIPIDSSTLDSALLWELLTNFNKFKLPMGCRQDKDDVQDPLKVASGHIYIILDVLEEKGNKMLKIANPWKNAPELKETKENNGVSKISYEDFLKSFSTFILVKDFPKDWKGVKFDCEIISSKGAPTTSNNMWIDNPQYIFEVKDKEQGNIIIRLHRYVGIQSLNLESLGSQFGFAVFNLTPTELSLRTPDLRRNITITKSNEGDSWTVANLNLAQGKYSVIPYTVDKGEAAFFYCELFFDFKENMISFNTIKKTERILEPSLIKLAAKQSWKPRVLKSTLRLSEVEGDALDEAKDNIMVFVPHTTTKILYKEGVFPKVLTRTASTITNNDASTSRPQMSRGLSQSSTKISVNKRLFDLKIDGQQDYEITAALFGLAPETKRTSVTNKGASREEEDEEIDYEILAELETIVDLNNYGLTDVGLIAVLDAVIQTKKIRVLKLAGNQLTDNGIINLVDKLERSHHFELEELDVSNNNIGRFGGDLLLDMSKTFKNLAKINIDRNKDISDQTKNKTNFSLKKKAAAKV